MNDSYLEEIRDSALYDLTPTGAARLNSTIKTYKDTYYFSLTNGFKDEKIVK
jgi:hypothetical protein